MKFAACLLLGLAVCAPAFAQSAATGTVRRESGPAEYNLGHISTGDDARVVLDAFAACLLREHEGQIMHGLHLPDETSVQADQLRPDRFNSCLGNLRMRFDHKSLRESFYKVLFKRNFVEKAPVLPVKPTDFAATDGALPKANADTVFHGKLLNFAECVVRTNPPEARQLVLANAGSLPEKNAITALSGSFGGCMTPGVTFSFSKAALVGLIAEAYYRDAVTPQTAGAQ